MFYESVKTAYEAGQVRVGLPALGQGDRVNIEANGLTRLKAVFLTDVERLKLAELSKIDATAAKVHETSRSAQFTIIRGGIEGTRKASLEEVYEFLDACELTSESAEWEAALAGVPIDIDGAFIQFIRCS